MSTLTCANCMKLYMQPITTESVREVESLAWYAQYVTIYQGTAYCGPHLMDELGITYEAQRPTRPPQHQQQPPPPQSATATEPAPEPATAAHDQGSTSTAPQ